MGVIRKSCSRAPVISFSDESINSLGISQPATPPSEPESAEGEVPFVPLRRDPTQLLQRLEHHRHNRRAGARRSRRADNTRALQTLVEEDQEGTSELSISDFQPKSENAFSKLLNDSNNMRVWQYFISRNEQEQREYLEAVSPKPQRGSSRSVGGFSFTQLNTTASEDQLPEVEGFAVVPEMSDCRNLHPAYSEVHRFTMMETQLQSLLKKKHLPLGVLSYLEEEIVEIFSGDPTAVYITNELTSFERLLLHALCQYNFLGSKSTNIAGVRRTKVENAHKCFHAPEISLTNYIDKFFRGK